ncbi:MAG: hypothetical protein E6Q88_00500 [Lysobacteraceae bacterium]|nr:MAG: hypothetical protein E6Q88_00500 [Xanthomonadaceae bacterium]
MPYTLRHTDTPMRIAEREWAMADRISFTKFTSCVGVLALSDDNQIIAIHLSLQDEEGNPFTAADVNQVMLVLRDHNYAPDSVRVIGQISVWTVSAADAWNALAIALDPMSPFPLGDGTYGAMVDEENNIQLTAD